MNPIFPKTALFGTVMALGVFTFSPNNASETPNVGGVTEPKSVFHILDLLALPKAHAGPDGRSTNSSVAFGDSVTSKVTQPLEGAGADCRSAGSAYLASCLSAAYKKAARAAGSRPDYSDARKILNDTAKKLDALARGNADKSAPKKRGKNGRYTAVKPQAVRGVNRTALKIVQEAETKLLRSTGSSQARKVHYQRIASAVGSTKKILRS
ncbi:MAG: hypothetical protein AAF393_04950 [Pseudomonadota bacterium]